MSLQVLTFNLNNPSRERAERQLSYLASRPEQVLVLTETAASAGCEFLAQRFTTAGYHVRFPVPERGERGVMIVSRLALGPSDITFGYLPHRAVAANVETDTGPVEVLGLYVPSRNATATKTQRKRAFLREAEKAIPAGTHQAGRIVLGDFNILEPHHVPAYRFFQPFEYGFYEWFGRHGYRDAVRYLHPHAAEYSWVGRTGDGYRYDHAHVSAGLVGSLHGLPLPPRTAHHGGSAHGPFRARRSARPGPGPAPAGEGPEQRRDRAGPVLTRRTNAHPEKDAMDTASWELIARLVGWLDKKSPVTGDNAKLMRVLKIGEEFGEVAEAVHGAMAANPRKGESHTWEDVNKELCDVAITSLIALASLAPDAQKLFEARLQHIAERSLS